MQHRLMILGSMDEFVSLVQMAKNRGYYVIVCDGYEQGPAKEFADESFTIDVRNTEAIAALCKDCQVDGIVASFSDLLAECLVNIATAADLPVYAKPEKFKYLREKLLMKQMFEELDIPSPKAVRVNKETLASDLAPIGFPCVVKPANGYGSRGVYILNSVSEVEEVFDEVASFSSFEYILAETLNQGFEINMQTWLIDGIPQIVGMADREKTYEIPNAVPHVTRIVSPSIFFDEVKKDALEIVEKVAGFVGMTEGPLSMQFFYVPGKGIEVCEIAGRLFGYEHELVELSSGYSLEELLLDYVYEKEDLKQKLLEHQKEGAFFAHAQVIDIHGYEKKIGSIKGLDELEEDYRNVQIRRYHKVGDEIRHGVGAKPYVFDAFSKADTRAELDEYAQLFFDTLEVKDEQGNNLLYKHEVMDYDFKL